MSTPDAEWKAIAWALGADDASTDVDALGLGETGTWEMIAAQGARRLRRREAQ